LGNLDSFLERALQTAARGIQVTSAVEELCGNLIAGEIID
jgi:hypothetical protein